MQACKIRTRLLWKEWRQSRCVSIALVAVPPLAFLSASQTQSWLKFLSLALAAFGAPLLTAVWAGGKANRAAPAAEFAQAHLPVRPLAGWYASFLVPLLVTALCGAWYGVCSEAFSSWHYKNFPPTYSEVPVDWGYFAPTEPAVMGAVFLASCFAACYVVAMRTSLLPAVLVGVLLTLRIGWNFWGPSLASWESLWLFRSLLPIAGAMASFGFAVLGGKKSRRGVRIAVLCLAAGLVLLAVLRELATELDSIERLRSAEARVCAAEAPDGSFLLETSHRDGLADHIMFELRDRRSGRTRERAFERNTCVIDVRERRYVYLAQQLRGQPRVKILVWDSVTHAAGPLASLPAGRNALPGKAFWRCSGHASPKGDYLVLALPTASGSDQSDLWLVDLRSGRSALVLPDQLFAKERASWGEGQVILSGHRRAVVVDLEARRARFLAIPLREGDKIHG